MPGDWRSGQIAAEITALNLQVGQAAEVVISEEEDGEKAFFRARVWRAPGAQSKLAHARLSKGICMTSAHSNARSYARWPGGRIVRWVSEPVLADQAGGSLLPTPNERSRKVRGPMTMNRYLPVGGGVGGGGAVKAVKCPRMTTR